MIVKSALQLTDWNRKCTHERYVNKQSSCLDGFAKPFILMMSIYFYELVLLFFIFHHNFCNNDFRYFKAIRLSGVIIFLQMSFQCSTVLFIMNSSVAIFNKLQKKTLYPVHIVFIILVSLFMNIRVL